jgi:hypothetical protein
MRRTTPTIQTKGLWSKMGSLWCLRTALFPPALSTSGAQARVLPGLKRQGLKRGSAFFKVKSPVPTGKRMDEWWHVKGDSNGCRVLSVVELVVRLMVGWSSSDGARFGPASDEGAPGAQ